MVNVTTLLHAGVKERIKHFALSSSVALRAVLNTGPGRLEPATSASTLMRLTPCVSHPHSTHASPAPSENANLPVFAHCVFVGALRQLTSHVTHVLPVSDDGGSTAEIVRVIGGPAVGDIRSRCLRLADDSDAEVSWAVLVELGPLSCLCDP